MRQMSGFSTSASSDRWNRTAATTRSAARVACSSSSSSEATMPSQTRTGQALDAWTSNGTRQLRQGARRTRDSSDTPYTTTCRTHHTRTHGSSRIGGLTRTSIESDTAHCHDPRLTCSFLAGTSWSFQPRYGVKFSGNESRFFRYMSIQMSDYSHSTRHNTRRQFLPRMSDRHGRSSRALGPEPLRTFPGSIRH